MYLTSKFPLPDGACQGADIGPDSCSQVSWPSFATVGKDALLFIGVNYSAVRANINGRYQPQGDSFPYCFYMVDWKLADKAILALGDQLKRHGIKDTIHLFVSGNALVCPG